MAKTKGVSDEVIIAALLQHGTTKDAAAAIGISPRTIYDRMRTAEFQAMYAEAKTSIARKAVFSINEKLGAAIDTVAGIMDDQEINAAVRLQAAQTIINNAAKFAQHLDENERAALYKRRTFSGLDML